jgi:hypothetical protein
VKRIAAVSLLLLVITAESILNSNASAVLLGSAAIESIEMTTLTQLSPYFRVLGGMGIGSYRSPPPPLIGSKE